MAPFTNFNGNTFSAIARTIIANAGFDPLDQALARSLAGHIVEGSRRKEKSRPSGSFVRSWAADLPAHGCRKRMKKPFRSRYRDAFCREPALDRFPEQKFPENIMNSSYPKELPASIREKIATLEPIDLEAFLREYTSSRKSKPLAFWLLLPIGLHYAYVGRWWMTIAFLFTCGGIGVWWLLDLFRVRQMVGKFNEDLAFSVFRKYKA